MTDLVTGQVVLPADLISATAAVVRVEIHDTSFADAPSVLVAAQTLRDVPLRPGGTIPFSIPAPPMASGRTWTLRVHVSLNGAEAVREGDLLTTVSVPVPEGLSHVVVTAVR